MPRPGPRRQFTGAVMTDEQRAALQERADRDGVDMSEVIRRAVDAYLGAFKVEKTHDGLTFTTWVVPGFEGTARCSHTYGTLVGIEAPETEIWQCDSCGARGEAPRGGRAVWEASP